MLIGQKRCAIEVVGQAGTADVAVGWGFCSVGIVFAGLDTTEIGCCGIVLAFVHHPWTGAHPLGTTARCSARKPRPPDHPGSSFGSGCTPGCYSCSPEAGIRSFAASSNTGQCHLERLHCLAYSHASCCIHRDLPG